MQANGGFWARLEILAATSKVRTEYHKGAPVPGHPRLAYPLDGGPLQNARAGIHAYIGSAGRKLSAALFSLNMDDRSATLHLLLGCSPEEVEAAERFHNADAQSCLLFTRP